MSGQEPGELRSTERALIARLLEATVEALDDQRLGPAERATLLGFLRSTFDAAALAIRQGWRAHLLDRLTADLDRQRELLAAERGGGR